MTIKKIIFLILTLALTIGLMAQKSQDIRIDEDHYLIPLKDSIFIHVSFQILEEYGRVPANGLLIIKNGKAIMVDTPWNNDKTETLTTFLKEKMNVQVEKLIIGHSHEDCMGGLEYLQSIGVESLANSRTLEKCIKHQLPIPSFSFQEKMVFDFYGEEIICQYFGGGHSSDNITVYLPMQDILFGGCLVKSKGSRNLGFTGDAVIEEWAASVQDILDTYPEIRYIVPGHGSYGDIELLNHTIQLVEDYKKQ